MKKLNALIVDDEELARRLVRNYCERTPQLKVVGEAANPMEAIPILREENVDILFLDIQMPGMTGLDFLRTLRDLPAIILTTAYSNYALESYDLEVVDYLLKPFSFERFLRSVARAEEVCLSRKHGTRPDGVGAQTYQLVKSEHKIYRIAHADIRYVESMREYVAYHTGDGKRTLSLGSLKRLEEELPENFIRVHKSYIVAIDQVTALEGNLLHLGNDRIPIGGTYQEMVKQRIFAP